MKSKSDEDYEYYINYLRSACYRSGAFPDTKKATKMLLSGELRNKEEYLQWIKNEEDRLAPIQRDNDIALDGTDEEVIELAKRLCPDLLC